MARRSSPTSFDPGTSYAPSEIVVSAERIRPEALVDATAERLPLREIAYRLVREQGSVALDRLAEDLAVAIPGGIRGPYGQEPAAFVLRLVLGSRLSVPPLAGIDEMIQSIAEASESDPDYGFEVRPA